MSKQYWPNEKLHAPIHERGYAVELRGALALEFVEKWGMVQGIDGGEDSAGRARLSLMPIDDVISRAVHMADGIVSALEEAGWIREPALTTEAITEYAGELAALRSEVEFANRAERTERMLARNERKKALQEATHES